MIVYVVKTTMYSDQTDVYGVYSNLALAGHAAMQFINCEMMHNPGFVITFNYYEEIWGYWFTLTGRTCGDVWQCGEIEISRVTVNE